MAHVVTFFMSHFLIVPVSLVPAGAASRPKNLNCYLKHRLKIAIFHLAACLPVARDR